MCISEILGDRAPVCISYAKELDKDGNQVWADRMVDVSLLGPLPSWVGREECELILTPEQQARIAEVSRLRDLPYDGVAGTPPDWFPFHVRGEFLRIRSRLLLEYSAQHILLMIQHLDDMDGTPVPPEEIEREGGYAGIPARLRPDVWRLLEYKRVIDLGRGEGLKLLLGEAIAGNERVGESRRRHGKEFGDRYGKEKSQKAAEDHKRWRKEADKHWVFNRWRTINNVAILVKNTLGLGVARRTIRRAIAERKPKRF